MRRVIKKSLGFTLIEMLVVIMIVAVTLPLLMTVFVSVLRQQARVKGLEIAKSQADEALSLIKTTIKNNALSIHSSSPATDANEICNTQTASQVVSNPMVFLDNDGNSFYFDLSAQSMRLNSTSQASPTAITSAPATISNLSFSCERRSNTSNPIISVSFQTSHPLMGFSINYQTKILLRNK
jgi:prepilin-type N-terminal cleavage/methylation domain-containing protein